MAYIQKILGLFECPLQRVRFLALAPTAVIPEHTDCVPESGTPSIRLHIPIITNDKVSFLVQGEEVKMQSGELWYVDVVLRHSVANYGDQARIHLVIDCQLNDWLIDLIHGDGARELHNALYSQHAAGV
jgi:aspartyl/asparaginyl beta-hydroxylase (cupin superfamily)